MVMTRCEKWISQVVLDFGPTWAPTKYLAKQSIVLMRSCGFNFEYQIQKFKKGTNMNKLNLARRAASFQRSVDPSGMQKRRNSSKSEKPLGKSTRTGGSGAGS